MTKETMSGIDIRIRSIKGVSSGMLAVLDRMFEREFGRDPVIYSDSDWFVMGFVESELVSRVGILRRAVTVKDDVLVVGGISGLTTLPQHRRRGYATSLMTAAQEFMRQELPADYGLLICNEGLRTFYERLGWTVAPGPTVYVQPDGVRTCPGLTMVLEYGRLSWPPGPIDLCGRPW
jgi:GNAT superfamily N-acetyltransferase